MRPTSKIPDHVLKFKSALRLRRPLLPARHTLTYAFYPAEIQAVIWPRIFAHLRGLGGRWYPYPGGDGPATGVSGPNGEPVEIGDTDIGVSKAEGDDLTQFPGRPQKNPFIIDRGEDGKQIVVAAKFSFRPPQPCDKEPPFTIVQTYRYGVANGATGETLGGDVGVEQNPQVAPFVPQPKPNGQVESFDVPGPNVDELKMWTS